MTPDSYDTELVPPLHQRFAQKIVTTQIIS
jgi:hypothetical protein